MTDYIILKKEDQGRWKELPGVQNAASAKAAVSSALNGSGRPREERGGEFVAVPARSWQPVKVQVETALKFS